MMPNNNCFAMHEDSYRHKVMFPSEHETFFILFQVLVKKSKTHERVGKKTIIVPFVASGEFSQEEAISVSGAKIHILLCS